MYPLIDEGMVATIRETGNTAAGLPPRSEVLEKHGLPCDREAENVIISGCQIIYLLPHILSSLSRVLERGGFSFTFLSREYCCGNYLYRPAIKARDDEAIAGCRELSKEFVSLNMLAAKELGARRLVIVCSPCYPIYKHAFPKEDIVFYPQAIAEAMGDLSCREDIDYYAGCYRLHRRFSPVPMDLDSTEEVFSRLDGLEINRIDAPQCCYKPEGAAHIARSITTGTLVTICSGCYGQAIASLPPGGGTEVLMLPELVERALDVSPRG
ncbi:MAG: (Fe-S)-binding protein [Actinomycetota bacterium]